VLLSLVHAMHHMISLIEPVDIGADSEFHPGDVG
jgi:hypothetical protein